LLPIVVANWKMNGSLGLLNNIILNLKAIEELTVVEIVICPPSIFLSQSTQLIQETKTNIKIGAQNCYFLDSGAYTGEISTAMLQQLGIEYVIVGHSERRKLFFESDIDVVKKVLSAQQHGIIPIVCIGESLAEREQQQTFFVLDRQLEMVLAQADFVDPNRLVIAYEPVWAIGTGSVASVEHATQVHSYIKAKVPTGVRILYGGSLKPDNAEKLFRQADISGGLVGGAALQAKDFISICESANRVFL
jgi:triosephosphate isomerase